jgi:hypothetical protein
MPDNLPMSLDDLASALLRLPPAVREYLGCILLDSTMDENEEIAIEEEAHRRALEMVRGEVEGVDADEMIAELRSRPRDIGPEPAWVAEARRRWEAFQRGEEEILDFDDVMAQIRSSLPR